jgi:hypothetical protein
MRLKCLSRRRILDPIAAARRGMWRNRLTELAFSVRRLQVAFNPPQRA